MTCTEIDKHKVILDTAISRIWGKLSFGPKGADTIGTEIVEVHVSLVAGIGTSKQSLGASQMVRLMVMDACTVV